MNPIIAKRLSRIVVADSAPLPYLTAARALAADWDVPVQRSNEPEPNALNLGPVDFACADPAAARILAGAPEDAVWELLLEQDDGTFLISGATPLAAARASLQFEEWLAEPVPEGAARATLRTPRFRSLDMEFDDWTGGFNRLADGFDLERHVRDIVRLGATSLEVNMLADAVPVQVRERRVHEDKYQWWCIYCAGLDMFVESRLNRGTYDCRLLERNLATLKRYCETALKWGLTPTVVAFEPRVVPERFFDKHPDLRGARVDCSDYSAEAEFALDPCHPLVREHYRELMRNLLAEAPRIGRISIWSQDSNAGFPWARQLYAGPNGPRMARKRPVEDSVRALAEALRDGGREINPDFKVTVCLAWFQDHEVPGRILPDEIAALCTTLPPEIDVSFTIPPAGRNRDGALTGRLNNARGEKIRSFGREPRFQVEGPSNWWKPLGPVLGAPHPLLTFNMLRALERDARALDVILRGGVQTEVFVPRYVNNAVIRAFLYRGSDLDIDDLLERLARKWTRRSEEAAALVRAWKLCDRAVAFVRPAAWTVNFVSGRTLWRRLVRPLVPNQALLEWEDRRYYRHLEFTVGPTDPAWIDHFYKGWGRMVRDDQAVETVRNLEQNILPPLREALAALDAAAPLTDTARDVRDRIACFLHMLTTDRHLLEIQEAIHACLAEDRKHPERSRHTARIRRCIDAELTNTRASRRLVETSPATLIPVTSGEETPFMIKAPLAHQLHCKIESMKRHRNDPPGPWFDELEQPGGWTSDLRPKLDESFPPTPGPAPEQPEESA